MLYKGVNYDWVVAHAKELGKKSPLQIQEWFGNDRELVIFDCTRFGNKGGAEEVYVVGAAGTYATGNKLVKYIKDTGNGYGSWGNFKIHNIYTSSNLSGIKTKKTVYVFK